MRVKITAGWEDTKSITKRLTEQFLIEEIENEIQFVYDDSYDVIVFNNYVTENIKKGKRGMIFFHEPTWSGNHQKNFTNIENLTIFGFNIKNYNIGNNKFIESPAKMLYGGRGPWTEGHNYWTYKNLINKEFKKTKNISSVVSSLGLDGNYGPEGCLYKERSTLISYLINEIDFVDFYGWGKDKENMKGSIKEKKDGIETYKFSICIENSNEKNYVSEKFFDCILTETVPIYFGCENIETLVPKNCFIPIKNINDLNQVKNQMIEINNNIDILYNEYVNNIRDYKKKYFTKFNLIKDIIYK